MENRGRGLYQKLRSGISNLRRTAPVSVSAMELALQSQHSCTSGPHHFGSNGGRSNVRAGARTCCAKKERNDSLAHCLTLLSSLQPTRFNARFSLAAGNRFASRSRGIKALMCRRPRPRALMNLECRCSAVAIQPCARSTSLHPRQTNNSAAHLRSDLCW
jgi:hypothetical protein